MNEGVKNVALFVLAMLVALAAAELLTRAFYAPRTTEITTFRLSQSGFYQRDEELGWLPKKNVQGRHDKPGSFESTFETNAHGLRDSDHPLAKHEGTRRIVVLGDSFAWGFGVNNGEIFTDYLESSLSDMEVINLGVTAYGLRQEIDYFKRLGIKFAPDVLVLALVMNDISDARDGEEGEQPKTAKAPKGVPARNFFRTVKQALAGNSALYTLLQDVTNQYKLVVDIMVRIGLKEPPLGFDDLDSNVMPALWAYPAKLERAWKNAQAQLLELKAICERYGIRFIIALVPSRQSIDKRAFQQTIANTKFYEDDFDLDKPYQMLMAFGEMHDVETVNPLDAFRDAAASGADLYLTRDMHFSKDGHRLFSAQIRNHLLRNSRSGD